MLNKIGTILIVLIFSSSLAFAGWKDDFAKTVGTDGLAVAVSTAQGEKASPLEIVQAGQLAGVNLQNLISAMVAAGISTTDIVSAMVAADISTTDIVSAMAAAGISTADIISAMSAAGISTAEITAAVAAAGSPLGNSFLSGGNPPNSPSVSPSTF